MNDDLRHLVDERLRAEGLHQKNWYGAVLASCDGRDALEAFLNTGKLPAKSATATQIEKRAGAFLTSLTVEGFRGIGPRVGEALLKRRRAECRLGHAQGHVSARIGKPARPVRLTIGKNVSSPRWWWCRSSARLDLKEAFGRCTNGLIGW